MTRETRWSTPSEELGQDETRPVMIRADELVVTMGESGATYPEVPLVFDTAGERIVVLLDARALGGPVMCFGLAGGTGYAVAMALLQMRRRLAPAGSSSPRRRRASPRLPGSGPSPRS